MLKVFKLIVFPFFYLEIRRICTKMLIAIITGIRVISHSFFKNAFLFLFFLHRHSLYDKIWIIKNDQMKWFSD